MRVAEIKKAGHMPAFLILPVGWSGGGNCNYRAGIDTYAAIDAGIRIDSPLFSHFTDGICRAGIITCAAVDALIGNNVRQDITSFSNSFQIICSYFVFFQAIICAKKNPA
jgi:hypothetical protein